MRLSYRTEQWLPCPVSRVFAFFANPANLPRLMPAWQEARIDWSLCVAAPPPPLPAEGLRDGAWVAGEGSKIALSFRPFPRAPFRLSWHAEIAEFTWNDHFCDRQLSGPFAYWNHCHSVRAVSRGTVRGTLIVDDVQYELPFGVAGQLAHRLFLRRQIERTFAYRQGRLARIFAPVTLPSPVSQPE